MRAAENREDLSAQMGTDLVRGVLGDGRFEDLAMTDVERDLGRVVTVHAGDDFASDLVTSGDTGGQCA